MTKREIQEEQRKLLLSMDENLRRIEELNQQLDDEDRTDVLFTCGFCFGPDEDHDRCFNRIQFIGHPRVVTNLLVYGSENNIAMREIIVETYNEIKHLLS